MKLYTIKDISEKTGKDKSNVYRYIKKNSIAHTTIKGQTLMYNEQQKNAIISGMTSKTNATNAQRSQWTEKYDTRLILQKHISDLEKQNKMLIDQLQQKDHEISAKNKQINEAHRLIDQQQQLNLSTQRFLEQQKSPQAKQQQNKEKESQEPIVNRPKEKTKKKGFFKRLFDK